MTTAQNIGYCTAQCWYDNVVYTPAGRAGRRLPGRFVLLRSSCTRQSNGRAWLLSTDGGATWSDLTQDGDPNHAEGDSSGPARHRHGAGQAAALHHRLGRRRRPLGRQVRRHLRQVRHARFERGGHRALQEPAQPRAEPVDQHEQRLVDPAVPEPLRERAAAEEPAAGRHAGQRDVPVQRFPRTCGRR